MNRTLALLFGAFSYVIFLIAFVYQVGFVAGFAVPKTLDDGVVVALPQAIATNVILLSFFAIQHTIMARLVFKRWWKTIVPEPIERSIYVLLASLLLLLMNWLWKPMPEMVWQVQTPALRTLLYVIAAAGWILVLYATFVINHFDLFGLRQVWLYYKGIEYTPVQFKETVLYRWVRHPLMLGFIIAFWASPDMSQGHLLFAGVTTAYILIAIQIEERTLLALHGAEYQQYQTRVSMILPMPPKAKA